MTDEIAPVDLGSAMALPSPACERGPGRVRRMSAGGADLRRHNIGDDARLARSPDTSPSTGGGI